MTSTQIQEVVAGLGWSMHDNKAFGPHLSTDVAQLRATLDVAYQLAYLNERLDAVLDTRDARLRVMVEPGEYPILTQTSVR